MHNDTVQVAITFTPHSELQNGEDRGIFTFSVDDLIIVREKFFSATSKQGQKRGKDFLSHQVNKSNFDWNVWVSANESSTLETLIDMGLGKVYCRSCRDDYPTTALIVYEWSEMNGGGLQFTCPNSHIVFTRMNLHGEFFENDQRRFMRVIQEQGSPLFFKRLSEKADETGEGAVDEIA